MADVKYRKKITFRVKVNEFLFCGRVEFKVRKVHPVRAAGIGSWIYRSLL